MKNLLLKLTEKVLYQSSSKLRPYERSVLDAWRKNLSSEANTLLSEQLKLLVLCQRQIDERYLCFFPLLHKPCTGVPEETLFPCRISACVVAVVRLVGFDKLGVKQKFKAEVMLHRGRLDSIQFDQPPRKKLRHGVDVTRVDVLRDPMVPSSDDDPLDAKRREEILAAIQSKLPDEYLTLVGDAKAISINDWEIHGLQGVHKLPKSDGDYYLLAFSRGIGAVGVKEGDSSGQLYYLDDKADDGEEISAGLKVFLEQFERGKASGGYASSQGK